MANVNCKQSFTFNANATGGTFRIVMGTERTAVIAYNATVATVKAELEALIQIRQVTVTLNTGATTITKTQGFTVEFTGVDQYKDFTLMTAENSLLTTANITVTKTQIGSADKAYTVFTSIIDNALIKYFRTASGLDTVIWADQSAYQPAIPYGVIKLISIQNQEGAGFDSKMDTDEDFVNIYRKGIVIRFQTFCSDGTHNLRCGNALDYTHNESEMLLLDTAGINFQGALNDVTDVSFLQDTAIKGSAVIDLKFGITLGQKWTYGLISRVSGEITDIDFDVDNI